MAHKHCEKHDLIFPDGGVCWNCEEVELHKSGKHDAAYRDAKFLQRRGGAPLHQSQVNAAVDRLGGLSDEQLERLIALASSSGGGKTLGSVSSSGRKPIAVRV